MKLNIKNSIRWTGYCCCCCCWTQEHHVHKIRHSIFDKIIPGALFRAQFQNVEYEYWNELYYVLNSEEFWPQEQQQSFYYLQSTENGWETAVKPISMQIKPIFIDYSFSRIFVRTRKFLFLYIFFISDCIIALFNVKF